jgi:hypothetical protein
MIADGYHMKCYCAHPEHPHPWEEGGHDAENAMESGELGANSRTAAIRKLKRVGWKFVQKNGVLDCVCPFGAKNKTPWAKLSPQQRQESKWG